MNLRQKVLSDGKKLIVYKNVGYYDADLDMYFKNLQDWCLMKHGADFRKVINNQY